MNEATSGCPAQSRLRVIFGLRRADGQGKSNFNMLLTDIEGFEAK
jgi:hypothetical protein